MTPNQFLEMLASLSLQATLLIAGCWSLSRWTSRDDVRSRIWSACQWGLLGLLLLAATLPHFRIFKGFGNFSPAAALEILNWQTILGRCALAAWACGAGLSLALVLLSAFRVRTLLRDMQPLEDELSCRPGGPLPCDAAQIYVSDAVHSPCCWQFHRPVIILPRCYLKLDHDELELILRHELAHLQWGHPLQLFVQRLVEALFWFHPLVRWAGRQADLSREMACDAAAAETREEITDYLWVLLKVIDQAPHQPGAPYGLGLFIGRQAGFLARRARRLAERAHAPTTARSSDGWLPASLLALIALVSTAWLPVDVLDSPRSHWSPCPGWSAAVLHDLGIPVRDYEVYDRRLRWRDRLQDASPTAL